jgi:large subunit ribosomal protein L1
MGKRGKKYQEVAKLVDKNKEYTPEEAIELAKKTVYTRFDPTVELHIRTGVDPRHAEQQIRGVALLPHGTGKRVKILVFAEGEAAKIAQEAGADYVGGDELIEKIMNGWLDFDIAIAVPQMMGKVAKLGKILGPRKLMPSPKSGTVVPPDDLPRVIEEARKGRVEFRVDKTGNLHIPIGKASFTTQQLLENMAAVMDTVMKIRPSGLKGQYIKRVYLTTTMGPSIKVNTALATSMKPAE